MTRNEIINEINCLLSELDNGDDAVSYLTQNDVNWLKENIKALEQELKWIPVTERLPDNSGRYWVNYSLGYVGIAHYYESVLKWGCTTTERIVAWMPLPKPYKAESEE